MKRLILQALLLLFPLGVLALGTAELIDDPAAEKVFRKKCIRLGTSELLPLEFETVCRVLDQPRLVQAIQDEFCRSVSKTGEVDFPVIRTAPKKYYYIEDGKRTDVTELYKQRTDEFSYDYIVHAYGKRFFGKYDVVIHLQIVDVGDLGVAYSVSVHAYPHNWFTRTSHKIGLTKRYFKDKMKLTSWVAREIAIGLCEQENIKNHLQVEKP